MPTDGDAGLANLNESVAVRTNTGTRVPLSAVAEAMLRVSPDPVFVVDRAGRYLHVGEAGARLIGLPASEIVGRQANGFGLSPGTASDLAAQTDIVFQTKQPHTSKALIPTEMGLRVYEHHFTPLFDADGEVVAMLCMARDLTDQQPEAEAVQEREMPIRSTLQAAQMGTFEVNIATNAAYLPEETKVLLGLPPDASLSTRDQAYQHIHPEDRPLLLNAITQSSRTGEPYLAEFRVLLPEGGVRWLAARGHVEQTENGQRERIVGVLWDISWRKDAELALRQKEAEITLLNRDLQQRLQEVEAIVQTVPVAVNIAEDTACTQIKGNQAAYQMLRTPYETNISVTGPENQTLPFRAYRNGEEIPGDDLPMQVAARTGQQVSNVEMDIVFEDGVTSRWLGGAAPLFDAHGNLRGSVGAFVDITERKQAEDRLRDSEERLRFALDAASMVAWDWDVVTGQVPRQGDLMGVLGMPTSGATGNVADLLNLIHPEDRALFESTCRSALAGDRDYRAAYRIVRPDGEVRWIEDTGRVLRNTRGDAVRFSGVLRDVTEQRLAQEEIERLNASLHRAVYESNHRIKNQLQVLSATADMVLMDGSDVVSADALRRLRSQLGAVAATHDILTMETRADGAADHIPLKSLLERTLAALQQTTDRHRVRFTLDNTLVPVKTATSTALLLNEVVSNGFKHGASVVDVRLVVNSEQAQLEVCDDGPGFPDSFDVRRASKTGLELLMTLAGIDLQGTVEFTNRAEGGARVVVLFPLPATH